MNMIQAHDLKRRYAFLAKHCNRHPKDIDAYKKMKRMGRQLLDARVVTYNELYN